MKKINKRNASLAPTPAKDVRICGTCGEQCSRTGRGWRHYTKPKDGHKPSVGGEEAERSKSTQNRVAVQLRKGTKSIDFEISDTHPSIGQFFSDYDDTIAQIDILMDLAKSPTEFDRIARMISDYIHELRNTHF